MNSKSGFFGVYPMIYALFNEDGSLSRQAMRRQIEAILHYGVHGIAALGLATEVNKLSTSERRALLEWVAEDVDGKVPLSVTIAESNIPGQVEFAKAAADCGAQWVILQPPPAKGVPENELIRFFGAVAERSALPVAIQNAPEYLGYGLSNAGLKTLNRVHPNVSIVKVEAPAIAVSRLIEELDGSMDIFNGRAGIDMIESIRAGAVGVVPGGECFDVLVQIFNEMTSGDPQAEASAERRYGEILPLLVFLMESLDTFLVYGKQIMARRLCIQEIAPRSPFTPSTSFGLASLERQARMLAPL